MNNLVVLFVMGIMGLTAQPAENISSTDEIVWFGMDYSQVKLIGGQDAFSDLDQIQGHYFRAWNELILTESDKYDIKGAFDVRRVTYDMEFAISQSEQRESEGIRQMETYSISEEQVNEMVWQYTDTSDDRIGAVLIMESLDKLRERSTMWLAVFDIATGEILDLKWYTGTPGGFGFWNYWARSYYNVLKSLKVSPRKPI